MTVQQVTKLLFRIRDSSTFSSFIVFDWKQWITKSHITLFPNVDTRVLEKYFVQKTLSSF
jgi:hypothetical protein